MTRRLLRDAWRGRGDAGHLFTWCMMRTNPCKFQVGSSNRTMHVINNFEKPRRDQGYCSGRAIDGTRSCRLIRIVSNKGALGSVASELTRRTVLFSTITQYLVISGLRPLRRIFRSLFDLPKCRILCAFFKVVSLSFSAQLSQCPVHTPVLSRHIKVPPSASLLLVIILQWP